MWAFGGVAWVTPAGDMVASMTAGRRLSHTADARKTDEVAIIRSDDPAVRGARAGGPTTLQSIGGFEL
jgi:hypothetical protein